MVQCTIKDLNVICKMLEHHTDRCWYTSGVLKAVTVNKTCKAFSGTNSVHEGSTRKSNKVYNPQLLRSSAKEVLLTSDYKVEHLQIALGTVLSWEMCCAWCKHSSVDYTQMIPLADKNNPENLKQWNFLRIQNRALRENCFSICLITVLDLTVVQ